MDSREVKRLAQAHLQAFNETAVRPARTALCPPTFVAPLGPPARSSVERLKARLSSILASLYSARERGSDPLPDAVPSRTQQAERAPDPALTGLCTACEGGCCRYGETRAAYLKTETLANLLARRPDLSLETVADFYLSHVPEKTRAGSCVFHGPSGCGLPREARSDICNRFYCRAARQVVRDAAGSRDALVLIRDDSRFVRAVQLGLDGGRAVTLPPAEADGFMAADGDLR